MNHALTATQIARKVGKRYAFVKLAMDRGEFPWWSDGTRRKAWESDVEAWVSVRFKPVDNVSDGGKVVVRVV